MTHLITLFYLFLTNHYVRGTINLKRISKFNLISIQILKTKNKM